MSSRLQLDPAVAELFDRRVVAARIILPGTDSDTAPEAAAPADTDDDGERTSR